jgi:hypothetical protein
LLAFVRTSTLHGRTWQVLEKTFAAINIQLTPSLFKSLQLALH